MSKKAIDIGSAPNDGTGDQLRTAFSKVNDNFDELYLELGGDDLGTDNLLTFTLGTIGTSSGDLTLAPAGTSDVVISADVSATGDITVTGDLEVNGAFAANNASPKTGPASFGATDTSPSVASGNLFKTDGTDQTLTTFDDGVAGQIISVVSTDDTEYVVSGNLKCGLTGFTTEVGDVTQWVYDGTNWFLLSWLDVSELSLSTPFANAGH
jgi:hypothetical protein